MTIKPFTSKSPISVKGGYGRTPVKGIFSGTPIKGIRGGGLIISSRKVGGLPTSPTSNSNRLTAQQQRAKRNLERSDKIIDRFLGARTNLRISDFTGGKNPNKRIPNSPYVRIPISELRF